MIDSTEENITGPPDDRVSGLPEAMDAQSTAEDSSEAENKEKLEDLPPFPLVLQRAIQLINSPDTSIKEVVDVIQCDQSITASVLRVCNSAYFGLRREIRSLKDALVLLGFNPLMEMILSQQSIALFSPDKIEAVELWRHSLTCALLSGILSRRLEGKINPMYYTAALVHDVGKLAMLKTSEDYWSQVTELMEQEDLPLTAAERKIWGVDHAELGSRYLESWSFPETMIAAVRYHHTPLMAKRHEEIARRIQFCDLTSMVMGINGGPGKWSYKFFLSMLKEHKMTEQDYDWLVTQLKDRFAAVEKTLDISDEQKSHARMLSSIQLNTVKYLRSLKN